MKNMVIAITLSSLLCIQATHAKCKPFKDFVINAGDTVTDPRTGIEWKRCFEGQQFNKTTNTCIGKPFKVNWFESINIAQNSRFEQKTDWRVPSVDELKTVFDCDLMPNFRVFPLPLAYNKIFQLLFGVQWEGDIWTISPEDADLKYAKAFEYDNYYRSSELVQSIVPYPYVDNKNRSDNGHILLIRSEKPNKLFAEAIKRKEAEYALKDAIANIMEIEKTTEKMAAQEKIEIEAAIKK